MYIGSKWVQVILGTSWKHPRGVTLSSKAAYKALLPLRLGHLNDTQAPRCNPLWGATLYPHLRGWHAALQKGCSMAFNPFIPRAAHFKKSSDSLMLLTLTR